MKKVILSVAVGFMIMAAGSAFAKSVQKLRLAAELSNIIYEEPGVMRQEGIMHGIAGSWTNYNGRNMLRIEGKSSKGQVDYRNSGTLDNIDDFMLELRVLGGTELPSLKSVVVMSYAGLGYRYLNDDSGGRRTSTGAWGYERESNYLYIPVGVEALAGMGSGWSLGATLEYDIFLWGKQISRLSDVNINYRDLENEQDEGYGWRGSIRLRKEWLSNEIEIEPFIRYWEIKRSDYQKVIYGGAIVGYGYEPKNNSKEVGLRLSLIF